MENKLKEIFQKKLDNYQAPVDASAWNAIQSGISGSAASTGGGLLASFGAKVIAAVIAASLVVAAVYFVSKKKETSNVENAVVKVEKTPITKTTKDIAPLISQEKEKIANDITKNEEKLATENVKPNPTAVKENTNKEEKTMVVEKTPVDHNKTNIPDSKTETKTATTNSKPIVTNQNPITNSTDPNTGFNNLIEEGTPVDFEIVTVDKDELSFQLKPTMSVDENIDLIWEFGNGTTSKEIEPTVYYDNEGEYEITLSFINNTTGKRWEVASHQAKAYYPISWEIQNIFTPNDDMYNQYFDPAAKAENLTIETVLVYDNYQNIVFTSSPNLKKWDGKLKNGELAPQGYYYYQVTAVGNDGEMHSKKGKVYLITGN